MYKFAVRIGAICKLRKNSLTEDSFLFFIEKRRKVIKRKLIKETADRLRVLIENQKLKDDNYIFYPNRFPHDKEKRESSICEKVNRNLNDSKCFKASSLEIISSHMFRATKAVEIGCGFNVIEAQKELNHSNPQTTLRHYIAPERRGLLLNVEEKNRANNDEIFLRKKTTRESDNNLPSLLIEDIINEDKKS